MVVPRKTNSSSRFRMQPLKRMFFLLWLLMVAVFCLVGDHSWRPRLLDHSNQEPLSQLKNRKDRAKELVDQKPLSKPKSGEDRAKELMDQKPLSKPKSREDRMKELMDQKALSKPKSGEDLVNELMDQKPLPQLKNREDRANELMALNAWKKQQKQRHTETCPCGSEVEPHSEEPNHGDICRLPDGNFVCPTCCTGHSEAPYCGDSLGGPCRVPCPTKTPESGTLYDLALVLRTWHKDVRLGVAALRSVVKVVPHDSYQVDIVVITDEGSREEVEKAVETEIVAGHFQPVPDRQVRVVVEEQFMNGNVQQKYSKLTADLHTTAKLIMHIDSDLRYHTWDDACFFADGHLPVVDYAPWSMLPDGVRQWKEGSERLLGIPDVEFEFSRTNQHIYPRELYSALRERVKTVTGKEFKSVFIETPLVGTGVDMQHEHSYGAATALLVSDFNLLGAMAYYHMPPGLIYFRNNAAESGTANCQSQCNSRLFSVQCCEKWFETIASHQEAHNGAVCGYDCNRSFLEPFAASVCIRDKQSGTRAVESCTVAALKSKRN